jgi:hypothetical protein
VDAPREIDWATAAVADRVLTVELTGEPSQRFASHLDGVLSRLGTRGAGAIKVTKRRIKVTAVDADRADDVRHLLESAVAQANADLVRPAEDAPTDEDEVDATLTAAFRGFAPAEAH